MKFSFEIIFPELIIIATAFFILISDLFFWKNKESKSIAATVALVGIILSGVFAATLVNHPSEIMGGRWGLDSLGVIMKAILLLATGLVIMLSPSATNTQFKDSILDLPEFFTILLFTLSGMMFLVSSRDLVTLYVSLEFATLPLFILTAWSRKEHSGEAAIKYLAMGALGSAFLLYGLGFLYGLTGDMSLMSVQKTLLALPEKQHAIIYLAGALVFAGVGFKLTLFPFHMWAPDAYQGAPTFITAFLSVASKAAGLILAIQLFFKIFGIYLPTWTLGLAIAATLTMTLGNWVAIRQTNLKRFMAYSSISQAGYLLMGFMTNKSEGLSSMIFYILIYTLTNLAVFGVLLIHIHQRGEEEITSLKGFSKTNPVLALVLMIALFGLAGIPPLAGFVGKFFLFSVAAQAGYYWLVAVAAINSTVSLYYYLRLVRQMYIEQPQDNVVPLRTSTMTALGLSIAALGSVVVGLVPIIFESIQEMSAEWLHQWLQFLS